MRNYTSDNFSVQSTQMDDRVLLTQKVHNHATSTGELPQTFSVLQKTIPTIFDNVCYNDKKYPFKKEVINTQVGHLFEHLILENLKLLKEKKFGNADFSGVTSWDWEKNNRGTFSIVVYCNKKQNDFFNQAFNKAILVLEMIYNAQRAGSNSRSLMV